MFKDSPKNRQDMKEVTLAAIDDVNNMFKLRRDLGCDVQFGKRYSEIH